MTDTKEDLPEIDPQRLFAAAPAVLRQLAMMTDSLLFYQRAGWYMPPGLILAAGDATALIFRLRKELQPGSDARRVSDTNRGD